MAKAIWKRVCAGQYVAYQKGERIAAIDYIVGCGAPYWEITIWNGVAMPASSKGNRYYRFVTLSDAMLTFERAARLRAA
mgnify:FL=1|tara:strand:+ start:1934 stop:2170 length:237 start_codon:yes stop_codon:yes gene_type:complete